MPAGIPRTCLKLSMTGQQTMQRHTTFKSLTLGVKLACGSAFIAPAALAQDSPVVPPPVVNPEPVEEVVVTGRLKSGAAALTDERIEVPFSADYLSFEVMARAGDSDIAAALRRVPGLTVIDGKFVYVRGLGERYSAVTVNGAAVPSPELTRSVVPLDLFPTTIVESVKIAKSPSPDQPANFGGGAIDIRTRGIPDDLVASVEVGLGFNDDSGGDGLVFAASSEQLPAAIVNAIPVYRGDITVSNIFNTLNFSGNATSAEARVIHQGLIDSLNTDVGIRENSLDPDLGAKVALGNSWYFGEAEEWRFGVLLNATYDEKYRNKIQRREGIGNPGINFVDIYRTDHDERTVAAVNTGLEWLSDHSVEASYYVLQNDEEQVSIERGYDTNNLLEDGDQKTEYQTRLEERELTLVQLSGSHTFAETPWLTDFLKDGLLEPFVDLEFDWFYSDSEATTDIPNQATFQGGATVDPQNPQTRSNDRLLGTTSMGRFNFLELLDQQESWGGNLVLPLEFGSTFVDLSTGWWGFNKARNYYGYNLNLNSVGVQQQFLAGSPDDVLNGGNLLLDNGFDLTLGVNTGNESYVAAQKVNAGYGMADVTFADNWRITGGARWESYQQAALPINLIDFSGNSIQALIDELQEPDQRLAIKEEDTYLSTALTYFNSGLFGADEYQFRFSFGETVVRPDLREISDVKYNDPELNVIVGGNPNLTTSPIDNFEARAEFYYANADNWTVSLFYKDIDSPIERIRTAGSDDNIELTFVNAEHGEVYGVELEGFKTLPRGLFLTGNVTLSDSELTIDTGQITGGPTNPIRRLTGHSEWVVNGTLGWDSDSGLHSAYLNYNVYGERIYYGGVAGNDDAFEQPFHSLGIVYKWFPTDQVELEFQVDNILNDDLLFQQVNANGQVANIIEQEVGVTFSASAQWRF
jgi:outer membrane receptor protein involved in Fe transport